MTAAVHTVLGEVDPAELGVCNAHDHLFNRSALLPGQELDDPSAAEAELLDFAAAGGQAVVQWTPYGMGGRTADLVRLAEATGVRIVAATGLHQAAHYPPERLPGPELAELFVGELTGPGPRAGLIKVAGGFHGLDAHAERTLRAAAEAHHATGAPIAVHHEQGTAADQVLDLLCGRLGVPPHRLVLGHLNRFPDLRLHRELAASGAFLAFDGPSRVHHATDHRLTDCLVTLAEAGHGGQLLLGGDTTTAAARGNPGMGYLLRTLRPRLARALGEQAVRALFVANPARAFAW
ncbi:phosphotriesterase family protein [Kitasatospora sp. NPDC054939]